VLLAARPAHGHVHGNAGELGGRVVTAELRFDVLADEPAGAAAARVAVVDREERFERDVFGR
jgi:hypothetical protein